MKRLAAVVFVAMMLMVTQTPAFAHDCGDELWSCSLAVCIDGLTLPLSAEGYTKANAYMNLIKKADRAGCGDKARDPENVKCEALVRP